MEQLLQRKQPLSWSGKTIGTCILFLSRYCWWEKIWTCGCVCFCHVIAGGKNWALAFCFCHVDRQCDPVANRHVIIFICSPRVSVNIAMHIVLYICGIAHSQNGVFITWARLIDNTSTFIFCSRHFWRKKYLRKYRLCLARCSDQVNIFFSALDWSSLPVHSHERRPSPSCPDAFEELTLYRFDTTSKV